MKTFVTPEIEILKISAQDVLCASVQHQESGEGVKKTWDDFILGL